MNLNRKILRFTQILFFILSIGCLQSGFCNVDTNPLIEQETVLTIDESSAAGSLPVVIFAAPGTQKLTIENHLTKDIDIGSIYFFGDEFTAPLIARGVFF